MKLHPKDLPDNIRKHYQARNATGGKIGLVHKVIKKNHTTIVIWSVNRVKEVWRKNGDSWIKADGRK